MGVLCRVGRHARETGSDKGGHHLGGCCCCVCVCEVVFGVCVVVTRRAGREAWSAVVY